MFVYVTVGDVSGTVDAMGLYGDVSWIVCAVYGTVGDVSGTVDARGLLVLFMGLLLMSMGP